MNSKVRTSKFNICLPVEDQSGHWVIFNGGNGAYALVNDNLGQLLDAADKNDRILPPMDEKTYHFLMRRGFLDYENQETERVTGLCERIHACNCQNIIMSIVPSLACNFECEYCFERAIRKEHPERLKAHMSREMVDAIFMQMERFLTEGKSIKNFVFFGGEPFLPRNKEIVSYACDKCGKLRVPMSVITNGYYLDEYLDIISKYDFTAVKITIDGPKEVHDARRKSPGRAGSFDRIVENALKTLETGKTVTFRTNVNQENSHVIPQMAAEYERLGLTKYPNFAYYFCATMDSFEREDNVFSNVSVMEAIGNCCSNYGYNSAYARIYRRLKPLMTEGKSMELKSEFCVAHSGKYTVDPFGNVYTCWDLMHKEEAIVAKVDVEKGEFIYNENFSTWNQRTVDKVKKCKDCKYMMFCGGGCAAQAIESKKDIYETYCDSFPEIFNQVAVQIARECLDK